MKYELLILYLLIINISAFIGGSVGAFLGMQFFRHKTKHPKFIIGVPVCFIINVIIILYILGIIEF